MLKKIKLSEFSTIVRGSSPRPKGDPRFYKGPVPRLMVADLTRDGMYVIPKIDSLTIEGAKKSRPMKKGDFIIAVSGDPGRPCILGVDACIHDGFAGLRDLDTSKVCTSFLYHFFKYFQQKNKGLAVGAIFKNLNTTQLRNIEIPLPPLKTQKRIAKILNEASALRDKTQQLLKEYDTLAQSIFLEMFGDPLSNQRDWNILKLVDVTTKIGSGATPRGGKESYIEKGVSLIRSLNIHDNKFKVKNLAFIDELQASKLKNVIIEEEDVLINITGASVARCTIVPSEILPARVNQHVSILRCLKQKVNPHFLLHLIISPNSKVKLLGVGSSNAATRESITKDQLESFEIIVPPIELQNQFVEKIYLIEKQKDLAAQELKESEDLFNSLLQKAFKGELVN